MSICVLEGNEFHNTVTHPPATDDAPPSPARALSNIVICIPLGNLSLSLPAISRRWQAVDNPASPPPTMATFLIGQESTRLRRHKRHRDDTARIDSFLIFGVPNLYIVPRKCCCWRMIDMFVKNAFPSLQKHRQIPSLDQKSIILQRFVNIDDVWSLSIMSDDFMVLSNPSSFFMLGFVQHATWNHNWHFCLPPKQCHVSLHVEFRGNQSL